MWLLKNASGAITSPPAGRWTKVADGFKVTFGAGMQDKELKP
jgi:hypothetical protein